MCAAYCHSIQTLVTGAVKCRHDLITLSLLNMSNSAPDTSSQPTVGVVAALGPGPSSLGPDARTSAVGATSLEAPVEGGKMVSEGKRKQEDDDSDAVDSSRTGKKLKLEASDVEELPLIWHEAASAPAAAVENSADVRDALRLQ
jgi:hypothetical protein